MQDLLIIEFSQLLADVRRLMTSIKTANTPKELRKFQAILLYQCEDIEDTLETDLIKLEFADEVNILEDLLSELSGIKAAMQLFSAVLAPPAVNSSETERVGLIFANWLYDVHKDTQTHGVAVATGRWSVYPSHYLSVFYIPLLEQNRLLYMPLLFHEFGHILYLIHRLEMDELAKEFQDMILDYLQPARRRNDAYAEKHSTPRQSTIHYTWYKWLVELYCDAVGFEIGGASYLHAFSRYLRQFRLEDFFQLEKNLANSRHPITWLRVKLLLQRARTNGFHNLANQIEANWLSISNAMNVIEDYFGYYDDRLSTTLIDIINDMVIQTSPKRYDTEDTDYLNCDLNTATPVQLANLAWLHFEAAPSEYSEWECKAIQQGVKYRSDLK